MDSATSKPKTVKITINGKVVDAEVSRPLIDAAEAAGVYVPRYCYHQDLSIAGVCRMCVVDVEKNPKLQISCNTAVTEGMVVRTDTDRVKEAVKSALELHLINHPLDCPICDKAGECKLQDFYSDFGLYQSRMDFDAKGHKPKVQDIGTIVLDSERCILCTRCVRFTAEVTKTNELSIFNRGDRSELRTFDRGPLRNDYTGNLADICPVGALTAKDFRFQQRVWFLKKTTSVCTLCARGCNTAVSLNPATKKLYRVEPRRNPEVNSSWICDTGRWGYHHVYDEKRIKVPKQFSDGVWADRTWDYAFQTAHRGVTQDPKRVLVALGGNLTNEEYVDLINAYRDLGVEHFTWIVDEAAVGEKEPYDKILKHRDLTSNAAGFKSITKALGVKALGHAEATAALGKKAYDWVFLLGLEGHVMPGVEKLLKAVPSGTLVVAHATSQSPYWERIQWLLPNVSSFEKSGTVVNALGRVQKLNAALPPQAMSRDGHHLAFGISKGNDRENLPEGKAEAVFEGVVLQKVLGGGKNIPWARFEPMGIPLSEGATHV